MLDSHNIILTPHLTEPLDDALKPSELEYPARRLLQSWVYRFARG